MLCDKEMMDHILKLTHDINRYLKKGYRLHRQAMPTPEKKEALHHAGVKVEEENSPSKNSPPSPFTLTVLEVHCLKGLLLCQTERQIASTLKRSTRTIDRILASLRKKFNCKKNPEIVSEAQKLKYIVNGDVHPSPS